MPKKIQTRNLFEESLLIQCQKALVPVTYEAEKLPYITSHHYLTDFIIKTPLGKIYIEAKGYFRPEDKRKLIAVKKLYPHIDLRIVFQRETKANVRWSKRHGFVYAIGKIPEAWFKGLL